MKKKRLFLLLFYVIISGTNLPAQLTFIGVSADYGTWIKEFGASAYGVYTVNDKIDLVPDLTCFLPHNTEVEFGTHEYTWWIINLNGHYIALEKSVFQVFGLMGLNFTNEIKRIDEDVYGQPVKDKITTTKLGLNAGAGVQLNLSRYFTPYTEVKYTFGEKRQFCFSLGIFFRIAPDKITEEQEEL